MRTLVLIPDGVGIRNFLCTEFISFLLEAGEVDIWHGLPEEAIRPFSQRFGHGVRWERFPLYRESPLSRVLRQAKSQAQLNRQNGPGTKRSPEHGRRRPWSVSRAINQTGRLLGRWSATPAGVIRLDRWHQFAAERSEAAAEAMLRLDARRPGAVFCTHQRASLAVPTMAAARRRGIPATTFIYSWDNPPKGRMAVHASHFLVWSEWMRHEMSMYYPEVPVERMPVVGTPQFEHYFNPGLLQPRDQFLNTLGIAAGARVVCFSGDDVATSPHDPSYLADTARALRRLPLERRPELIFRRCPVDLSGRYQPVFNAFPEIRISDPLWRASASSDWTQIVPTPEDVALLANLACHTDLMINLGSTMAMDAAIFGKPSIFVAYEAAGSSDRNAETIYRLPHFEWVHKLQPVYWARSADELAPLIAHALDRPDEKEDSRRAWIDKIVARPLDGASRRCAEALKSIAASSPFLTGQRA